MVARANFVHWFTNDSPPLLHPL